MSFDGTKTFKKKKKTPKPEPQKEKSQNPQPYKPKKPPTKPPPRSPALSQPHPILTIHVSLFISLSQTPLYKLPLTPKNISTLSLSLSLSQILYTSPTLGFKTSIPLDSTHSFFF